MGKYAAPTIAAISILLNIFFGYKLFNPHVRKQANVDPVETSRRDVSTIHTVQRIIDGDTFDTESGERIRLYGIDAPEYPSGCLGENAKTRLEELVLSNKVKITTLTEDNFGRQIALVYVNDLLINDLLVEEGLAYYSKSRPEVADLLLLEQTEQKAKSAKRGVWSALCETKKEECIIKGNYREADHTRLYHTLDCYNYEKITVKPGTSDRWFCTEEEAQKAGYRESADCPEK